MLLPVVLALAMLPLIGSRSSWVTLTVAGLAMGMMIFIMASGLTLVFGLMDVLNFGHGAFIAVGAYVATLVLLPLAAWMQADSLLANLAVLAPAALLAMAVSGALGLAVERVLILPGLRPAPQADPDHHGRADRRRADALRAVGAADHPAAAADLAARLVHHRRHRDREIPPAAMLVGLVVFVAILLVLNRTKIGLLIRAGVENSEMVEALGYRIRRLFLGVFMAGSGLAGLGGVMWGLYREQVHASMGDDLMVLVFIVVIIGGLGSVGGCFIGALLVAMVANYGGFLVPKLALVSNILLMVAILMWRPRGLYAVTAMNADDDPFRRSAAQPRAHHPARRHHRGARAGAVPVSRRQGAERRGQDLHLRRAGGVLRPAARLHRLGVVRAHDVLRHRQLCDRDRAVFDGPELGRGRDRRRRSACRSRSLLALAIGLFSLRVQAIFFAMITLAVASAFLVLASQLSWLTGGEDGRSFQLPELLRPGTVLISKTGSASRSTAAC